MGYGLWQVGIHFLVLYITVAISHAMGHQVWTTSVTGFKQRKALSSSRASLSDACSIIGLVPQRTERRREKLGKAKSFAMNSNLLCEAFFPRREVFLPLLLLC